MQKCAQSHVFQLIKSDCISELFTALFINQQGQTIQPKYGCCPFTNKLRPVRKPGNAKIPSSRSLNTKDLTYVMYLRMSTCV